MSQKSLTVITFCVTTILIIWMLHGSLCEIRMNFWGAEFAAYLQCKSFGIRAGGVIPRHSVTRLAEVAPYPHI